MWRQRLALLPEPCPKISDAAAADGEDDVDGWVELELPGVVGCAADFSDAAQVDGLRAVDLVKAVGLEEREEIGKLAHVEQGFGVAGSYQCVPLICLDEVDVHGLDGLASVFGQVQQETVGEVWHGSSVLRSFERLNGASGR